MALNTEHIALPRPNRPLRNHIEIHWIRIFIRICTKSHRLIVCCVASHECGHTFRLRSHLTGPVRTRAASPPDVVGPLCYITSHRYIFFPPMYRYMMFII